MWGALVVCAHGQEDDEDENRDGVQVQRFVFTDQQFDQLAFGTKRNASAARQAIESQLTAEIQALDQACSLTAVQRNKLRLAGVGDMTHWFHNIDQLRDKYRASRMDRQAYMELAHGLQSFRQNMESGYFGPNSMFRKTLRATLTEEQIPPYREHMRQRQLAVVQQAVQLVERNNVIRLTDERRQQLVTLLLERANPPAHSGSYAPYVVLFNARELEEPLKRMLDEREWAVFQTLFARAQQLAPTMRAAGMLNDIEAEEDELLLDATRKE